MVEYSPEQKTRIKAIKHLLSKYHPDTATADADKFRVLKEELLRLQGKDIPTVEEKIPAEPTRKHQWGDWYDKYIANSQ
jgi:hypothetical protein